MGSNPAGPTKNPLADMLSSWGDPTERCLNCPCDENSGAVQCSAGERVFALHKGDQVQ